MRVNEVYEGDCLDVMREFPDNCVDSVITDPPYDLTGKSGNGGFMGKRWDASGIAFNPEVWREALRIAKPGATLMAFGGSRTYHRLTCAIEDAGWEIRDCISHFHDGTQAERAFMASLDEEQLAAYLELHRPAGTMGWVFGSGFPKSLDIGKAIDKVAGVERDVVGKDEIYARRNPNGMTGSFRLGGFTTLDQLRDAASNGDITPNRRDAGKTLLRCQREMTEAGTITAPATPLAKQFDGYGTALKPAVEFIVVAMKPPEKNFAHNAGKWGVSGIWVDGARVGMTNGDTKGEGGRIKEKKASAAKVFGQYEKTLSQKDNLGRYPANLIHDGSEDVLAEFDKAGVRAAGAKPAKANKDDIFFIGKGRKNLDGIRYTYGDSGSAARYFQQCPPDSELNPCLNCADCIADNEPETTKGRWPANLIHDGSEEVLAEFDKAGVSPSSARPNSVGNIYGNDGDIYGKYNPISHNSLHNDSGSAARFFTQCPPDPTSHPDAARFHYCPKAPPSERSTPGNNHPTQKPLSLMRYLARLTKTPTGGIVLDPFGGSGTTALACIAEGRNFILIEKEPEYAEIARRRIAEYTGAEIIPKEVKVTEKEKVKQLGLW